ncbi:MAG TPA: biotin transporter BioY, partial [Bacillota bacterium]
RRGQGVRALHRNRLTLREMILAALFTALMVALGVVPPLTLPLSPVPVTTQTLGVMLAGSVLGRRGGALAMIIFLLLLVAGVPVLAGGRGGPGHLFGPSGGYILSWPLAAYVIGHLAGPAPRFGRLLVANVVGGILVVYAIGAPVLALVSGMGIKRALVAGAALFVPGDLLKAVVAALLAASLRRRLDAAAPGRSSDTPVVKG